MADTSEQSTEVESRNPTVLIWSIPTALTGSSCWAPFYCRNPTVLIWSIPTWWPYFLRGEMNILSQSHRPDLVNSNDVLDLL